MRTENAHLSHSCEPHGETAARCSTCVPLVGPAGVSPEVERFARHAVKLTLPAANRSLWEDGINFRLLNDSNVPELDYCTLSSMRPPTVVPGKKPHALLLFGR